MINMQELKSLIKGATRKDLENLIHAGINEIIPMTDKQLLKIIKLKNNAE